MGMSSSITTNNHLPNRRKGSNNKTSKKQKQQIKKQLPLQWAHITLSHDITKPRCIGGDNSSLNLILEHKVIYLQEKNNTPKWSIKLKDLDDIQGCGQVLQRIFNSQQHYDDGDEDTTDLDDECDDYDEQINVATEGMTWRDNVWMLRSKDHKRVICCCLGNDDFVKESSSFQMACGARSFRRTFEKVGDGIVRKEEEKEDEIRLRNGHNNSNNNGGGIGNDDNYHYHRNNNNNNKNNKRTMTQRKSQALKTPLPKRITTPIRSNNNNSNNNKRVLFKKNNSTTKKKRKNGDILDDVLYFSSDSDNIVAGKEDDDDDEDDTTEKEAKVDEDIVVEDEEKEAQFNDIENGKNDSDDGTIETIIIDNDNDNDNDEDSIEIINNNTNTNNNNNIDRSQ